MAIDQADNLRRMKKSEQWAHDGSDLDKSRKTKKTSDTILVSVTSGKGGVGKSNIALNLSISLADLGRKALLIDADTNLANLDILLGSNPKYNLSDVFGGEKQIRDILMTGPEGIHILPGSSGMIEMLDLEDQIQDHILASFTELEKDYDYVIIDTGAGLTNQILSYATASDEVIIVTNREPTAITDAYAMIKLISHRAPGVHLHLIVNMVGSPEESTGVFEKMNLVVQDFLNVKITYLGYIPYDPNVPLAVSNQTPFISAFPKCPASKALRLVTRKLMQLDRSGFESKESGGLFSRLINRNRGL